MGQKTTELRVQPIYWNSWIHEAFDQPTGTLFVDLTQRFRNKFRHLLIPTAPSGTATVRLIATFKLRQMDGVWMIAKQEDWYRTDRIIEGGFIERRAIAAHV